MSTNTDLETWRLGDFEKSPAQPAQGEGAEHPEDAHRNSQDGSGGGEEDRQAPEGGQGADGEAEEVPGEIEPLAPAHGAEVVPGEDGLGDDGGEAPAHGIQEALPRREDERAAGAVGREEHREVHAGRMNEECGMSNGELGEPVIVKDGAGFGPQHTLAIERVDPNAVYVRRDPPWPGGWWLYDKNPMRKMPDRPVQGYNRDSMEMILGNMTKYKHPALKLYQAAYARMVELGANE